MTLLILSPVMLYTPSLCFSIVNGFFSSSKPYSTTSSSSSSNKLKLSVESRVSAILYKSSFKFSFVYADISMIGKSTFFLNSFRFSLASGKSILFATIIIGRFAKFILYSFSSLLIVTKSLYGSLPSTEAISMIWTITLHLSM